MLFNSFGYLLVFLPVVALVHGALRARCAPRWPQAWLLLASLFFYGYAKPEYLALLLGSAIFNWALARAMTAQTGESRRKLWLQAGIALNLIFLCAFKYSNFFLGVLSSLGGPSWRLPDWELPLGISFFTLTQVMYLVDTYQGLNTANTLFDHATFVCLFPYVVAGPLARSRDIVGGLRKFPMEGTRLDLACRGLYLFALGLAKKVIFADSFAAVADAGFATVRHVSTLEAWVFSLAFTLQIYFDFSGYSDMARGSAWMLGIDIPENFHAPYLAKSISEFWQRWHISLSNFITNYLYTPMLRSMGRVTLRTSVIATLLAMAIAGLWHGPAWTYIIFGLLHGVALALNQIWKKRKLKMPDFPGWLLTLLFVNAAFVFFRASSLPAALRMLAAMLPHADLLGTAALRTVVPLTPLLVLRPVAIGALLAFAFKTTRDLSRAFRPSFATAGAVAALILLGLFFMNSTPAKQFVYFGF